MDLQTICRVCLCETSGMLSIFDSYNFLVGNSEIFKVITDCASVQIQKFDGFSEQICSRCLDHLSQAYSFKKLCEDSDFKFRNNLITSGAIKVKNEIHEEEAAISFSETHDDPEEVAIENCEIPDVAFIQVKEEQSNDEFKMEIKTESEQDGIEEEQLNMTEFDSQAVEQTYKCNLCDKEYSRKTDLVIHSRVHTVGKHTCDICKKTFTQKCNLVKHVRLHTGENAFKCDVCGKSVSTKQTLTEHIRSHTGEKPYKCNFCSKQFSRKYHLVCHSRIHTGETPYKCGFCEKTFTTKQMLDEHSRNHTGEQPYKCELCDKKYTRKYRLADHRRSHTGEKPYKCDYCETKFAQMGNLVRHMERKHGLQSVSVQ